MARLPRTPSAKLEFRFPMSPGAGRLQQSDHLAPLTPLRDMVEGGLITQAAYERAAAHLPRSPREEAADELLLAVAAEAAAEAAGNETQQSDADWAHLLDTIYDSGLADSTAGSTVAGHHHRSGRSGGGSPTEHMAAAVATAADHLAAAVVRPSAAASSPAGSRDLFEWTEALRSWEDELTAGAPPELLLPFLQPFLKSISATAARTFSQWPVRSRCSNG